MTDNKGYMQKEPVLNEVEIHHNHIREKRSRYSHNKVKLIGFDRNLLTSVTCTLQNFSESFTSK